jgi:hypothetical protein
VGPTCRAVQQLGAWPAESCAGRRGGSVIWNLRRLLRAMLAGSCTGCYRGEGHQASLGGMARGVRPAPGKLRRPQEAAWGRWGLCRPLGVRLALSGAGPTSSTGGKRLQEQGLVSQRGHPRPPGVSPISGALARDAAEKSARPAAPRVHEAQR